MTLDEVYMIGVFDSVSYEASKPSSWKFGVPVINPFSGKEATENEVKLAAIYNPGRGFCGRKRGDKS